MSGGINLIEVNNVSQTFKVNDEQINVLKNINFNIKDNSFNIIYGQSGSGKSTLLNILTGLQKPTSGQVKFDGEDVYSYSSNRLAQFRANRVGFVYQQNFWVKSLNVIENVALPLYFLGYSRKKSVILAKQALERVGMSSYIKKYPVMLSGGEQQRIAMARAISSDPMFIIADEPTGNLDSTNGDKIMDLLQECHERFKRTIVLVTHNMEYLPMADHLLHIEDGFITDMESDDIHSTAKRLVTEMQHRIDDLLDKKKSTPHD